MCRWQENRRETLRIEAFYVRLAMREKATPAPDEMTLVYLPGGGGEAAAAKLSRERKAESGGDVVFGSAGKVTAGEGTAFGVYLGEAAAVEGRFRRRGGGWRMECWRGAVAEAEGIERVDVCVAREDRVAMVERVEMREKKSRRFCSRLDDIVEEEGSCGCCKDGDEDDAWEMVGHDDDHDDDDVDDDDDGVMVDGLEREVKGWALDVGIWAVCLGVGYLVSRVSSSRRRRKFLPF